MHLCDIIFSMKSNKRVLTLFLCIIQTALTFIGLTVFGYFRLNKWVGVGVGGGIMLLCLIIALTVKKKAYLPVILFNSLAVGIAISSLYTYLGNFPPSLHTALAAAGNALLFGLYCILSRTKLLKRHPIICGIVFLCLVLGLEITGAVLISPKVFGFALFLFLNLASHVIALSSVAENPDDLIKKLAVGSFAVLALTIFIVIVIISEGDGLDGLGDAFDAPSISSSSKKKKDPFAFTGHNLLY